MKRGLPRLVRRSVRIGDGERESGEKFRALSVADPGVDVDDAL